MVALKTRQKEAPAEAPQAVLTLNAAAARLVFPTNTARAIRIRLEQGTVYLHGAKTMAARQGEAVLGVEWKARGVAIPLYGQKRLLNRLYRMGLTQDRPYFLVEPSDQRGWFTIAHSDHAQRAPSIVVSGFEPPPVPIDTAVWRRIQRLITLKRAISEDAWTEFYRMASYAAYVMERKNGRVTIERAAADRLLKSVARYAAQLEMLRDNQPEFAPMITKLLGDLDQVPAEVTPIRRGRPPQKRAAMVLPDPEPEPETETETEPKAEPAAVTTSYVAEVIGQARRDSRGRSTDFAQSLAAVVGDEEAVSPEPERKRRARRRWPLIPPVVESPGAQHMPVAETEDEPRDAEPAVALPVEAEAEDEAEAEAEEQPPADQPSNEASVEEASEDEASIEEALDHEVVSPSEASEPLDQPPEHGDDHMGDDPDGPG